MQKNDVSLTNFIQAVQAISQGRTEYVHGPSVLEFSWSTACNLRFRMCSQSNNPPVIRASKEQAAPFLEHVLKTVILWNPSATSEPLLNDVDEIVRLCSTHEVYLNLYTNAVLLKPDTFEKLAPWIYRLTLSIDTHVPEILEAIRLPIRFMEILPNLEHALKRTGELSIPCVFNTALMKDTVVHYPDFVDWVADLGGNSIMVLDLIHGSGGTQELDAVVHLGQDRVKELLEAMKARAVARGVNLVFHLPESLGGGVYENCEIPGRLNVANLVDRLQTLHARETAGLCPQLAYYLKVGPDGSAYPCCLAPEEFLLGNVFEQDFEEVWNGEMARNLRATYNAGRLPEPCRGCLIRELPIIEIRSGCRAESIVIPPA